MTVTESDLAESRNALSRTGREIQQAAKYCSGNYITAASNGQRRAIDETMNYATQSLGTMIHHINHLASAFLALLDERTEKMLEIEEKVTQLAMEVKIRREKVARKAIGSCTASKVPVKCTLTKVRQDPPMEYVRRPIDYSILDHIGHGTRSQEPVTSPYGAPVVHAQTLTRRGSTATHQMGHHGNTINPKAMSIKVGGEYAATSVTASDYQSGTVGRTAGIYRTGVMGQYGNPYGGQQQVLVPMGRNHPSTTAGGGSSGYTSNSTGSLGGPSRRSSSSSGNQPRTTGGYAPAGMHMAQPQHQGVPLSTGYATKQQVFTDQGSPSHEQMVPPHQAMFARQHSEPGNVPASSVQHHLPAQYQQSPQAPLNRPTDVKNVGPNDLPPPPTEIPASSRPQMSLQLDGAGCAKSRSQGHTQQQQQQYSQPSTGGGIGGVDLSRLQPGPMDQLRPRQHNDPPWAPHHYIQKVITVYEYTADKSDELTFGENELIYVIKKNDDGWWEGIMMNGRTGLFPGNYVEVIN